MSNSIVQYIYKIFIASILLLLPIQQSLYAQKTLSASEEERIVREIIGKMSLEEMIGQLFSLHVPLQTNNSVIRKYKPGSIFLDYRNIPSLGKNRRKQNIPELKRRLTAINKLYEKKGLVPPFYSIDQEGGYHKLLGKATRFPSFMAVAESLSNTPNKLDAFYLGLHTCKDLKAAGIQWNLSPVVDVQSNPDNPVIRLRSFSSNPQTVIQLATRYLRGMRVAGCLDSIKHFPGHGDTGKDSHIALPVVRKSLADLQKLELSPFRNLISNSPSAAVMTAHIIYPKLDNKPATLSKYWLDTVLRRKWGYRGIIITDNLAMKAIPKFKKSNDYGAIAVESLQAGADILLLTGNVAKFTGVMFAAIQKAVQKGTLRKERIAKSAKRFLSEKLRLGLADPWIRKALQSERDPALRKLYLRSLQVSKRKYQLLQKTLHNAPSAYLLNRKLSKRAIKSIILGKRFSEQEIQKMPTFANKQSSARRLTRLHNFSGNARILAFGKDLAKVLRMRTKNRKGTWLIYTNKNPFPYKKIGSVLKQGDSLIVTFSRTTTSRFFLQKIFFAGVQPAKANVHYIPKR
ncbi:MAG: glycoside hydrolase family 3 protein [Spirochaetota bacterium]